MKDAADLTLELLGSYRRTFPEFDRVLDIRESDFRSLWSRGFEELLPEGADWLVVGAGGQYPVVAAHGGSLFVIDPGELTSDMERPPDLRFRRFDLARGVTVKVSDSMWAGSSAIRHREWTFELPNEDAPLVIRSEVGRGVAFPREERVARTIASGTGWHLPELAGPLHT